MLRQTITRTTSLAVIAAALAAGPAVAQQDLRSPDTRDAAEPTRIVLHRSGYVVGSDLRSRDAAVRAETAAAASVVRTDLRSPDARDAANHISTASVRGVQVGTDTDRSDFAWGDAGIGAGIVLGLALLFGLMGVTVRHRHHSLPTT